MKKIKTFLNNIKNKLISSKIYRSFDAQKIKKILFEIKIFFIRQKNSTIIYSKKVSSFIKKYYSKIKVILSKWYKNVCKYIKDLYIKIKNSTVVQNKSARTSFMILVFVCILLTQSFGWLYDEYIGNGALVKVGKISHQVVQYDAAGDILEENSDTQTVIYESNMSNITKSSKIIEIKNTGTLDMEFSLAFSLEGTTSVAGIMYYRLYEVTNSVGGNVKRYATNNPISPSIETDTAVPISNMTLLNNLIKIDTIKVGESKFYRLDYGMYQTVNTALYSDESLSVHMNVYSSQVGVITNENTSGQIWEVQTEEQFREVLLSAVAGDTIKLQDDISISGSINMSKRINIDTNGYKLNISEDLIYDFVSLGDYKIDVTGTGRLTVGNNLFINTPKAAINIVGSNKNYDIVVGGDMTVNAIQDGEIDGVLLEEVRIVKSASTLIPVDIVVMSNTRLTVGPDVEVGYITSYKDSTNIEIVNNGYITQIDLSNMKLLDTFTKYQIYVYNLGEIYGSVGSSSIVLPSDAVPYTSSNNGNTLIIKGITSSDITVSGSDNFKPDDIVANEDDITVVPVEGEENAYIVYIKDSEASIESLLTKYFNENGGSASSKIAAIKKLIVYTVNAQYVENEDFTYMNSGSMSSLEYLNLENSRVKDGSTINKIKARAFYNNTTLKTVILPNSLAEIGDYAFYNVQLGSIPGDMSEEFSFLTIPTTVTKIGNYAFTGSKYVKFKSTLPPTIGTGAFSSSARIFVIDGTLDLYQNTTNIQEQYVYQSADLSDDRRYFVYETDNGVGISYIINNYVSGTSLGVPSVITISGSNKNVTSLGENSYRHMNIVNSSGVNVTLPDTLTSIDDYAFYNLNITSIPLNNVINIGEYSFYGTNITSVDGENLINIGDYAFYQTKIETLELSNIKTIGNYAFANSTELYEAHLGNVKVVGDYAFYDAKKLVRVYIENDDDIKVNNTQEVDLEVGENAFFSNWGYYVDGRLRFYVPDRETSTGKTILDLYKEKFSSNSKYIYLTGIEINAYSYMAVESVLYEYTVRQTSIETKDGSIIEGLEIISYQGNDIDSSYKLPTSLKINDESYNVISIGNSAYKNTKVNDSVKLRIENTVLRRIEESAFENFNLDIFIGDKVEYIGTNAFRNSNVSKVEVLNLNELGNYAFYNCNNLYVLKLGNVAKIGNNAIANIPNLVQLFLNNKTRDITVYSDSLNNIGTNIGDRLRIYVPEEDVQLNYYKTLLSEYSDYIYPTGVTVGKYNYGSSGYDIGEYTLREVTKPNSNGENKNGWELIEYHGPDLGSTFKIDDTVYASMDDIEITQETTWSGSNKANISFTILNNSSDDITDWSILFSGANGMSVDGFSGSTITPSGNGDYVTVSAADYAKKILSGRSLTFSMQFTWLSQQTSVEILDFQASMPNSKGMDIISIGDNAFSHTVTKSGESFDLNNSGILSVGKNAFTNLAGIRKVNMSNLVSIGSGAFKGTGITAATFNKLNFVGANAFSNVSSLYKLDLGYTKTLESNAISNAPNLYQVFFKATGDTLELSIAEDAVSKVGTATNDRMRFYVTNGKTGDNEEYVEVYRNQFPDAYKGYLFAYDYVLGSFVPSGISDTIDIGAYSIKETTVGNKNGYEFVEYHGTTLDSYYEFPTELSLSDNNIEASVVATGTWGGYTSQARATVTNTGDHAISSWQVIIDLTDSGEITYVSNWNNDASINGKRITLTNKSGAGIIQAGQSMTIDFQVSHSAYTFNPKIYLVKSNSEANPASEVISIGPYAFAHAKMNTNETFNINSDTLLNIGHSAFEGNIGLKNIIAKNCTNIDDYAFASANNLYKATFEKLTTLGNAGFKNASNLVSLNIGKVDSFKDNVLSGTSKLAQLYLNNENISVADRKIDMDVADNAFNNMGSTSGNRLRIYVPDGSGSDNITYLEAYKNTLPSSISPYVYEKGTVLGSYNYTGLDIGDYSVKETVIGSVRGYQIIEYHGDNINGNFQIPSVLTIGEDTRSVISIGPYAYYFVEVNDSYSWNLDLPSTVTYVGEYAFYKRNISSIGGNNLSYIGKYAFAELPDIISASFDSVTQIDDYAFYRNKTLYMVSLGTGVEKLGDYAFYNSWAENNLSQFYINTANPPEVFEHTFPALYWNGNTGPTIYVPYDSISKYNSANYFKDYQISSIGSIYDNKYVYEVIDTNKIKITGYMGTDKTLVIPDYFTISNNNYNVIAISPDAFDGASRLNSLTLGRYIKNIGNGFLKNNYTVKNIYVSSNNPYFASANGILYDKNVGTLIRFPNVNNTTTYSLESTTKVVASGAFANCSAIKNITFNSNLVAISDSAFTGATALKNLYFTNATPPYITGFEPFPMNSGLKIHYPLNGSDDLYSSDTFFSWYSSYLSST